MKVPTKISLTIGLRLNLNSNKHQPYSKNKIYCKKCKKYTNFYNKELWFKEHYLKLHNPMKDEATKRKNNPASHFKELNEDYKKGIFPKDWHKKNEKGKKKADNLITEEMKRFEKQGFQVIPIGRRYDPKPDIIVIKDNKVYAVEVESSTPDYGKYFENKKYFDDIIWILRKKSKN